MKLVGIIIVFLLLTQCASTKFDKEPPFKVHSAVYNNVVGGLPNSGFLKLSINFSSEKKVDFQEVYFNNQKAKSFVEKGKKGDLLVAQFPTNNIGESNLELHKNPKEEFGNKPPVQKEEIPFQLKENEAVIAYKIEGKINYFKIKNIQKGKSIFMQ